ncbi:MAG: TetR/AcrR family transcriptional regulator [Planctomycetota bacterium]
MQVQDERKRKRILTEAAGLFAARSFGAVRLEEVAAKAGVGKGTLYTYYAGKDELYRAVLYESFTGLVESLERQLGASGRPARAGTGGSAAGRVGRKAEAVTEPRQALAVIVDEFLTFAYRHPHLYTLLRTQAPMGSQPLWVARRRQMERLIERVLRRGNHQKVWHDRHPAWTAQFLPGLVRSVLVYRTKPPRREALRNHLMDFLLNGLGAGPKPAKRTARPWAATKRKTP